MGGAPPDDFEVGELVQKWVSGKVVAKFKNAKGTNYVVEDLQGAIATVSPGGLRRVDTPKPEARGYSYPYAYARVVCGSDGNPHCNCQVCCSLPPPPKYIYTVESKQTALTARKSEPTRWRVVAYSEYEAIKEVALQNNLTMDNLRVTGYERRD